MTAPKNEIEDIWEALEKKEEECRLHRKDTSDIKDSLGNPSCGVGVKIAVIETKLENFSVTLSEIQDTLKWVSRGIVGGLLIIVGLGIVYIWNNRDALDRKSNLLAEKIVERSETMFVPSPTKSMK